MVYDPETMRMVNQIQAKVGGLVLLPDQWEESAAVAELLADVLCLELPYDDNAVAKRLASWMIHDHIESWHELANQKMDTRWHPSYDESDPASTICVYALAYGNNFKVVPLQHITQYKDAAPILLRDIRNCQVRFTKDCFLELPARKFLAVKRGEYICIFRICTSCLAHIQHGKGFDDDYVGPKEDWIDNRQPAPRSTEDDDLWDLS